jgi:hypothetical protein
MDGKALLSTILKQHFLSLVNIQQYLVHLVIRMANIKALRRIVTLAMQETMPMEASMVRIAHYVTILTVGLHHIMTIRASPLMALTQDYRVPLVTRVGGSRAHRRLVQLAMLILPTMLVYLGTRVMNAIILQRGCQLHMTGRTPSR